MKRQSLLARLMGGLAAASLLLAACAPAATPTAAPQPTDVPPAAFTPMKVEASSCDYGGEFKAIEAVDAQTVKFTLCYPDPAFLSKVAFTDFAIQDQAYLDANGGDSLKMSEQPNGTGPYIVKEWKRGESITFEANPNYWGGAPKIKTLIFRWQKEAAQRLLELQAGTADGIDNPAPEDFATIQGDSNLQLIPRPALNIFYIGFNNTIAPFDNEKVRQAIAMGIDRQRIVDNYYPAGSSVAAQFVPESFSPGFVSEGEGAAWYDYDVDAAKALLAEAGYPDGFEVDLYFRNVVRGYLPLPDKVAQEIQAQLAELGITVTINEKESTTFLDEASAGDKYGLYLLGWGADYPDATNFYDYHFANTSNKQFGALFDDVVAAIRAGAQTGDIAARQAAYVDVAALIKQHVPMIPVAHGGSGVAYSAAVQNGHTSPLGNELFSVMDNGKEQFVWIQNGEPGALWCADETDGESLRACNQYSEALLAYKVGGVEAVPALAESWTFSADLQEWTFTLRSGVTFHNGATLDANDVVASFKAQWDATDPNHKGRTTTFEYFTGFFGAFLNAP